MKTFRLRSVVYCCVFASVASISADPSCAYQLKKAYQHVGVRRRCTVDVWCALKKRIQAVTMIENVNRHAGISADDVFRLLKSGSIVALSEEDTAMARISAAAFTKQYNKQFYFPLTKKQAIVFRRGVVWFVCHWLVIWLGHQETHNFIQRTLVMTRELQPHIIDTNQTLPDEPVEPGITIYNHFAVLADLDKDDEAVDDVVAEVTDPIVIENQFEALAELETNLSSKIDLNRP